MARQTGASIELRSMQTILRRIAGPRGMGPLVGLTVLLPLTLGMLATDPGRDEVPFTDLVAIVMRWGFVYWCLFVLLGFVIRWLTKTHELVRGILFVICYVLIEIGRTVTIAAVLYGGLSNPEINLPYRIMAGGLTGLLLFSLVAVVFNDTRSYHLLARQLLTTQETLRQNLALTEREFSLRRDETLSSVRSIVDVALREVTLQSGMTSDAAKRTVAELVQVTNSVVRPLSHELFEMPESFLQNSTIKSRVSFVRAMQLTTTERPFRPEVMAVIAGLIMLGTAIFESPSLLSGLAMWAVFVGSIYAVMWLARAYALPLIRRQKFGMRVLLINLIYGGYSVALGLLIMPSLMQSFTGFSVIYIAFIGMLMFGMIAFTAGLDAARNEVIAELARDSQHLKWLNARLGARLWAERRIIARTLHRDVQGVLVAATFRLERAIDSGEGVDDALSEVRELIEMAVNFVVQPHSSPALAVVLEQLRNQWLGVLDLDISIPDVIARRIDGDDVARQAVADVVAEFMTNSVKHGHASEVSISAEMVESDSLVRLTLSNKGLPVDVETIQWGMGVKMMTAVTLDQQVTSPPSGGLKLTVSIPVE